MCSFSPFLYAFSLIGIPTPSTGPSSSIKGSPCCHLLPLHPTHYLAGRISQHVAIRQVVLCLCCLKMDLAPSQIFDLPPPKFRKKICSSVRNCLFMINLSVFETIEPIGFTCVGWGSQRIRVTRVPGNAQQRTGSGLPFPRPRHPNPAGVAPRAAPLRGRPQPPAQALARPTTSATEK